MGGSNATHLRPHEDTEVRPNRVLEYLELERIDAADVHLGDVRILAPEEVECEDTLDIVQELEWSDVLRAELVSVTKAELGASVS